MLDGGQPERGPGASERTQAGPISQCSGERRELGGDHDPVPPAAVAAKLDVVLGACAVAEPVLTGVSRAPAALAVVRHGEPGRVAQPQAAAAGAQRVQHPRRAVVERNDRAADGGLRAGIGMP